MALDSITLYHLIQELSPKIIGARIDKIQQPEKEEVHLLLRSSRQSLRLLLNASATSARIHLTDKGKKNPSSPPMFCMILRKHLEGARIISIQQLELERVFTIVMENYNERGDLQEYHLQMEIMGKHSNLILVDPAENIILDGLKRYSHALSRYREVLPGRKYILPPSQEKVKFTNNEDQWQSILLEQHLDKRLSDLLVSVFDGVSPELAREIILRSNLSLDTTLNDCGEIDLNRLFETYRFFLKPDPHFQPDPCIYFHPGHETILPAAFTLVEFEQYKGLKIRKTDSLNDAVYLYYHLKSEHNTMEAKRDSLRKIVQENIAHLSKKLNLYEETIGKAQKNLRYQKLGEILTANLYQITPGLTEITVEDYTDPELRKLTIELDPALSGIQNAQRFFKKYNKSKSAIKQTEPLKESAIQGIRYLQALLVSIDQSSSLGELNEIHNELIEQSYIKHQDRKTDKKKKGLPEKHSTPHIYYSKAGNRIIVGRNNRQNDKMTWREAKPTDMWLHVKDIPGSHVIVPLPEDQEFPDDDTLLDAAALAIYFSQARGSSQVPVDYTHVKQIKKPKGAKPGMVVYEQNWTLYLTPETETLERLLNSEDSEMAD